MNKIIFSKKLESRNKLFPKLPNFFNLNFDHHILLYEIHQSTPFQLFHNEYCLIPILTFILQASFDISVHKVLVTTNIWMIQSINHFEFIIWLIDLVESVLSFDVTFFANEVFFFGNIVLDSDAVGFALSTWA
jgi:hypothetical protein